MNYDEPIHVTASAHRAASHVCPRCKFIVSTLHDENGVGCIKLQNRAYYPKCCRCSMIVKPTDHREFCSECDRWIHCGCDEGSWCTQDAISKAVAAHDPVNHPPHYTKHPSGIECIEVTRHMNFNRGNAIKYVWRAGDKGDEIEDLKKAVWYLNDEIQRLMAEK